MLCTCHAYCAAIERTVTQLVLHILLRVKPTLDFDLLGFSCCRKNFHTLKENILHSKALRSELSGTRMMKHVLT